MAIEHADLKQSAGDDPQAGHAPPREQLWIGKAQRRATGAVTLFAREKIGRGRRLVQSAFLAATLLMGWQFFLFYRWAAGLSEMPVSRPPAVEGFLPISALLGLKRLLASGSYDLIHPAGLTILLAALAVSLAARKGFCGWICPVGAVSNLAEMAARKWRPQPPRPSLWLKVPLLSVKYLLLFFFLYIIFWRMPLAEIEAFMRSPYNLVADAKMLHFFLAPSRLAGGVTLILIAASFLFRNPWCRYFCPYGALMGLAAFFSPVRLKRDDDRCIQCKKCEQVCPAALPVASRRVVLDNSCLGCLECVGVCPVEECLEAKVGPRRLNPWLVAAVGVGIFLLFWAWARLTGHWVSEVPPAVFQELYPRMLLFDHPSY